MPRRSTISTTITSTSTTAMSTTTSHTGTPPDDAGTGAAADTDVGALLPPATVLPAPAPPVDAAESVAPELLSGALLSVDAGAGPDCNDVTWSQFEPMGDPSAPAGEARYPCQVSFRVRS